MTVGGAPAWQWWWWVQHDNGGEFGLAVKISAISHVYSGD